MAEHMHLSVIICSWNRAKSLATTLASVEQSELPESVSWEVLIVDNNSSDDTKIVCQEFINRNPSRYRYLFEKSQGKSFALNTGIKHAQGEILAFTDDDVTVDKRWLAETLRIFESFHCLAVGGKIVDTWKSKKPQWLTLEGRYRLKSAIVSFDRGSEPITLDTPPYGANLSVKREAFEMYGNFRTDLGPTSNSMIRGEDVEFCMRLLQAGKPIFYAPKAIVFHPVADERVSKKYFKDWYCAFGQAAARIDRPPETTPRYLGFPRYLLRALFVNFVLWMTAISKKRRFFFKLQFISIRCRISEERWLWQNDKSRSRPK